MSEHSLSSDLLHGKPLCHWQTRSRSPTNWFIKILCALRYVSYCSHFNPSQLGRIPASRMFNVFVCSNPEALIYIYELDRVGPFVKHVIRFGRRCVTARGHQVTAGRHQTTRCMSQTSCTGCVTLCNYLVAAASLPLFSGYMWKLWICLLE
jgi:hypothetical protein